MIDTTIEIALTAFVTLILAAQLIALRFKLPYTLVLVFLGIAITTLSTVVIGFGLIGQTLRFSISWINSIYSTLVNTGLFVGLIVPPLIFEGMIHIKSKELKVTLRPALVLATLGVVLSTIIAGILVWKIVGFSLISALLFAAIVAPTDTITILQIFKQVNVPSRLSTLMDLEAGFNDATAIVLFSILISSAGLGAVSILYGFEFFLYNFFGGVLIGFIIAIAAGWMHKRIDDKLADVILTIAAVYGSYVLATGIGASGLISVVIVGLYFGNSTLKYSISKETKQSIISFWEIAAFIGNAVAFLLIGFETNLALFYGAITVILVAYAATIIARILTIYPTFAIFKRFNKEMSTKWSHIATIGGVRGALSIALLATLTSANIVSPQDLSIITSMVLGVVFISIIVQVPILSRYSLRTFGRRPSQATA